MKNLADFEKEQIKAKAQSQWNAATAEFKAGYVNDFAIYYGACLADAVGFAKCYESE